jgi:predicted nucleic acid-binding protein
MVLDASAAFDYLLDAGPNGNWVRELVGGEAELAAPHLIDLELVSALRRRVLRRELTLPRARDALSDFTDVALIRYPATEFLPSIWAMRASLNPYDAAYVVLSEALGVPLLTTDESLSRSHGHRAEIIAPYA